MILYLANDMANHETLSQAAKWTYGLLAELEDQVGPIIHANEHEQQLRQIEQAIQQMTKTEDDVFTLIDELVDAHYAVWTDKPIAFSLKH